MTDRELLELATKAAGISGAFENGVIWYKNEFGDDAGFNPLADDGDALRLAVRLNLSVVFGANYVIVGESIQAPTVNNADDPCAATRRAIVRAAAEIGRAMP